MEGNRQDRQSTQAGSSWNKRGSAATSPTSGRLHVSEADKAEKAATWADKGKAGQWPSFAWRLPAAIRWHKGNGHNAENEAHRAPPSEVRGQTQRAQKVYNRPCIQPNNLGSRDAELCGRRCTRQLTATTRVCCVTIASVC